MKMKKYLSCLIGLWCSSHAIAGEWDYPANTMTASQAQEAKQYLQQAYPNDGDYRLRYETHSTLGTHYNFDVWIDGQYQPQKTMVVSTNKNDRIVRVFKSLKNTTLNNGKPAAASEIEDPRSLKSLTPPELSTGTMVSAAFSVFDPDLRTMDREPKPASQMTDIAQYPNPAHYVIKDSDVLLSNGKYYLSNPRVRQVDALALVIPQSPENPKEIESNIGLLAQEGVATFSSLAELKATHINEPNFAQIMAFSHLDASVRYITSLGFTIFDRPIDFDASALSANNSSYYYGAKALLLGTGGGSPDSFDADVVLHELGHGIHYHIVPDWAYGHTGAIGEGFGDYWAGSYSYRQQFTNANSSGQEFEIDTVFNWDGYFGAKRNTRSLWNQKARYFKQADYRAHESVAGELGDELWSTPLFQSLKQGVTRYGITAFSEFDTIVLESMYGLGRGLKMHDLAESMVFVANTLYPNKEYAQILTDNFTHHGLLLAPFKQEITSHYISPNKHIEFTLLSTQRQAMITGDISINNDKVKDINSDLFDSFNIDIELPTALQCGQSFNTETNLSYQFSPSLLTKEWTKRMTLIKGTPTFSTSFPLINTRIPDATTDSSGRPIVGLQTVNFTAADHNGIVDDNFGVYLHIEHSHLIDLTVTLISPRGTRVTLLNHKDSASPLFQDYFTIKHDSIITPFKGEPSWGTWRLEIADFAPNDSGKLISWGVGSIQSYQCTTPKTTSTTAAKSSSGGSFSLLTLFLLILFMGGRQLPSFPISFTNNKKTTL